MKKLFMFLILGIFLISLASAGVSYEEENLTYNIDSIWPTWLGGNGESVVKLIENTDECLIDCSFTLEFQNQKPLSLLEDINFINRKGETVEYSLLDLKFQVGRYENITKTNPIYEYTCEDLPLNETNQTNETQNCYDKEIGQEEYTEKVLTWNNYNGEELDGLSYLKLDAKKDPKKSMDWIITFRGEDLVNWAWWNTSWEYKREITQLNGTISTLYNITYDTNMNSDFSDLRFLDSTESTELNYTIISKVDSTEALVRVNNLNATSVYMYYGNAAASYNGNFDNLYSSPSGGYVFDTNNAQDFSSSGNNGTISGATYTNDGYLGSAYYFDGADDYITAISGVTGDTSVSAVIWLKPSDCTTGGGRLPLTLNKDGVSSQNTGFGFGFQDCTLSQKMNILIQGVVWGSSSCATSDDSNWHFYVLTRNGNTYSLYEDGSSSPCSTLTNAGGSFSDDIMIGTRSIDVGIDDFDGTADELLLYNYILTTNQMRVLYEQTQPNFTVGSEQQNAGVNIEFVTPPTPVNYANITDLDFTVEVNVTLNEVNFTNITYYMQNANGTEYIDTFTNETYSLNYSLPTGHFHYNVTACGDSDTLGSFCDTTETRQINHDITPPEINLTSPNGTYDYLIDNYTLDLNWTVTDEGSNESIDSLDSCWYEYNGTNNSLTCNDNHTTFNYIAEINNLTFYANDTFGNTQSEFTEWNYKVLEYNQTYNEEVTEGSLETFLAHIKLGSGISIEDAVLFNYNGTETTGQAFESGVYEVLRKTNMLVPSVSTDTNFTFYWGITLSDDTEVNLSSQNQTVYNLAVDNCSSYTNELFNFTVLDEEQQTIIPAAVIETALNFYDSTRSEVVFNYSMQFEGVNPLRICLNRNITNDTSYSLDVIVRYESSEHANEYYNIINSTIDADTIEQDITLYDLNLSDSTEFQLTFTGADFLPVENALIYVDRQYIQENTFKTVELPKTDYNGQTILHLVRNDVIYNIRIIKDGEVLGNFENIVAFCQDFTIGDCKIELNAFDSVEAIYNYDDSLGIIFTEPTYNETSDKITFNFVTEDGSAKTVKLEVTRNDIFGNRSICNSTLTSSGGTLTCNIDPNLDDSTLKTEIYVDNVLAVSGNVKLDTSNYGVGGYLILFVMAISFILMFSGSKTGVLVSMALTFIAAISLGLVTGDIIGIGASGLWLIIIIVIGIIKLNNERAQ